MERRQRHISQKGGRPGSMSKAVTSLAAILTVFPHIYIYIRDVIPFAESVFFGKPFFIGTSLVTQKQVFFY